jgi:hypothetical protein
MGYQRGGGIGKAVGDFNSFSARPHFDRAAKRTGDSPDVDLPFLFALLRDSEPELTRTTKA